MKKNLVTGGCGFIGSNLIYKLLELDEHVICIDNLSSGNFNNIFKIKDNKNFDFIQGDILQNYSLKFDRLWHLACPASPKKYMQDPILTSRINFEGTLNLLKMAKFNNAKVIFASSSEVYGDCNIIPQDENIFGMINTRSRRSFYSNGKRLAETLCFDFIRNFNMEIKIARIFNAYGPRLGKYDGRVISNFIYQALNNKPLTIFGNGDQTRSFCYVSDIVDALLLLMEDNYIGAINIGNDFEISIKELAKIIDKKIFSKRKFIINNNKLDEPLRRCPSLKLIKKVLDWSPNIDLEKGLDYTINSIREES